MHKLCSYGSPLFSCLSTLLVTARSDDAAMPSPPPTVSSIKAQIVKGGFTVVFPDRFINETVRFFSLIVFVNHATVRVPFVPRPATGTHGFMNIFGTPRTIVLGIHAFNFCKKVAGLAKHRALQRLKATGAIIETRLLNWHPYNPERKFDRK